MKFYRVLDKQVYFSGNFSIVPIRSEDRYSILKWRNEQMYHLRQNRNLLERDQDKYFKEVIGRLFNQEQPDQILFSYLSGKKCIGYGGLVHINWIDKNAEVSFIMDTELEKKYFEFHWRKYLNLIEQVAFEELSLHKIYTYAFDIRQQLYPVLEKGGFNFEAELKEHCLFEKKFISVKIHSKRNSYLSLRSATKADLDLTLSWANNSSVRRFSYNKKEISASEHTEWFFSKLRSSDCEYYILQSKGVPAGSIRFDLEKSGKAKISYLLNPGFSGRGFGTFLLKKGLEKIKENQPSLKFVYGQVFKENKASIKIFENLRFEITFENDLEIRFEKKI